MSPPATEQELLSRYIDGDLSAEELDRVERLLVDDLSTRRRLEEMRCVVEEIDSLPREASPPTLRAVVHRRVSADSASRRWLDRVQDGLQRLVLDSPLPATFAIVVALGVSFYLLAHGVTRRAERPTSLIVAPGTAEWDPGAAAAREIGGRRFFRQDGRWWEEGVAAAGEAPLRGDELLAWLALHPEDRALAVLGGEVVVVGTRAPVVLAFPASEGAQ